MYIYIYVYIYVYNMCTIFLIPYNTENYRLSNHSFDWNSTCKDWHIPHFHEPSINHVTYFLDMKSLKIFFLWVNYNNSLA